MKNYNSKDLPLISIITVILNQKNKLEKVIKNVGQQYYPNIEHIIIDGGSTDGSQEVLNKYSNQIAYWISENDNGIYDAMNKGIDFSSGEWIYFLGADDSFFNNNTLKIIFEEEVINSKISIVFGNVLFSNGRLFKSRFNKFIYFKNTLHHQGVFYRHHLFNNFRYGHFLSTEEKFFRVSGDYQLNLFLYLKGIQYKYIDMIIAKYDCGGLSMQGTLCGYIEEILIRHHLIGFKSVFFDCFSLLRFVRMKFIVIGLILIRLFTPKTNK
jgi:putative colanic acid biosynthesis glycosyltransferase WcaE